MDKAFAYIRVSTATQADEGFSLDNQKRAIIDFSRSRNIRLLKVYVDEGKSGRTINRPQFQEMLKEIQNTQINCVVIYKIDRFARNVADFSRISDELKQKGVRLISLIEGDLSAGSSLVGNIFASVAQWESEVNGERTKDALMQKFREGWQPTPPPIGYVSIGEKGERKTCEPDLYTAPIIQELFALYATGDYSIIDIVNWLKDKNIISKNGTPLGHTVVCNILNNPFYYGLIRWHGESKLGKHKPIISKAQYDACQYILAKHRDFLTRKRVHSFLLRGFAFCSECGQRYTAEWHKDEVRFKKRGGKIGYYHCQKLGRNGCPAPYIEVATLEKQFESDIKRLEFSDDFIKLVVKKAREKLEASRRNYQSVRQGITNRKTALEAKRNKLEDNLLDGVLDKEVYMRQHTRLQKQIDGLDEELSRVENNCSLDIDFIERVLFFTKNIHDAYYAASYIVKRHFLRFFYEKLMVKNKKIEKVVYTPFFKVLFDNQQVILRNRVLPLQDSLQNGYKNQLLTYSLEEVKHFTHQLAHLLVETASR